MQRTPPVKQKVPKESDEGEEIKPPSALLGAVTRKQNEIVELLPDMPSNLETIKLLYAQYKVKVENLKEVCRKCVVKTNITWNGWIHGSCL